MSFLSFYFQYTHISNDDLKNLRSEISMKHGQVSVLSPNKILFLANNPLFGKFLCIKVPFVNFNFDIINTILDKYNTIKLVFIQNNLLVLTPQLFHLYQAITTFNLPYFNLYCLRIHFSVFRLFFYKLRVLTLCLSLKFQETFFSKYNIQYVC